MKHLPSRSTLRGIDAAFTLIEALMATAIIGVLLALLLPLGGKLVERVRLTSCQAMLRQLAVPANAYQIDNRGYLPPRGASTSTFKSYMQYFKPYLAGDELFLCPKASKFQPNSPVIGSPSRPWRFADDDAGSYALNYALCPERAAFMFKQPLTDLQDFAPRSEIPMFIDGIWPGFSAEENEWSSGRIPLERHQGASVLFVDGSVAFFPDETARGLKWNRNYLPTP